MLLMPQDDYYLWHCDWCDSINRTLWTRVEENTLSCAACHKTFPAYPERTEVHSRPPLEHARYQVL